MRLFDKEIREAGREKVGIFEDTFLGCQIFLLKTTDLERKVTGFTSLWSPTWHHPSSRWSCSPSSSLAHFGCKFFEQEKFPAMCLNHHNMSLVLTVVCQSKMSLKCLIFSFLPSNSHSLN